VNKGTSAAYWSFVSDEASGFILPEWLEYEPRAGLLLSGEKARVRLTTHMRPHHVESMRVGAEVR
jgi:hypothetical protein